MLVPTQHEQSCGAAHSHEFLKWLKSGSNWNLPVRSVLDVGCRSGVAMTVFMDELPSSTRVLGLDIDQEAVDSACVIGDAVQGDLAKMPFTDGEFDWVFCSHTLEHLYHIGAGATELCRVAYVGVFVVLPLESDAKFAEQNEDDEMGKHKFNTMNPLSWVSFFHDPDFVLMYLNLSTSYSDTSFALVRRRFLQYGGRLQHAC